MTDEVLASWSGKMESVIFLMVLNTLAVGVVVVAWIWLSYTEKDEGRSGYSHWGVGLSAAYVMGGIIPWVLAYPTFGFLVGLASCVLLGLAIAAEWRDTLSLRRLYIGLEVACCCLNILALLIYKWFWAALLHA